MSVAFAHAEVSNVIVGELGSHFLTQDAAHVHMVPTRFVVGATPL